MEARYGEYRWLAWAGLRELDATVLKSCGSREGIVDRLLAGDADFDINWVKSASVSSTNAGFCSASAEVVDEVAYCSPD